MFENELQTRAAICGTGVLLGIVLVLAHLPLLLLIVPNFVREQERVIIAQSRRARGVRRRDELPGP